MLYSEPSTGAARNDYKKRVLRVLVHIQAHLDEALELDDLARVACFSPYHFHRVFTGMTGGTVKAHVRRLRLERSAWQLKTGGLTVLEIALAAGYESHEAFTRAFQTAFGMPPSRYRTASTAAWELSTPERVHWTKEPLKNFRLNRAGLRNMNVQIKDVKQRRAAFVRHVGPYNGVGAAWEKVCMELGKEGLLGGDVQCVGVCYDDPDITPPDKIRYDACITVDEKFVPTGDIGVQTLPGCQCAVITHFGPYETLSKTYAQIFGQWLPRSGRKLSGMPSFEVYLNAPDNTAPEDLITDIYVPLEPVS